MRQIPRVKNHNKRHTFRANNDKRHHSCVLNNKIKTHARKDTPQTKSRKPEAGMGRPLGEEDCPASPARPRNLARTFHRPAARAFREYGVCVRLTNLYCRPVARSRTFRALLTALHC